jgi:hypothetical protein
MKSQGVIIKTLIMRNNYKGKNKEGTNAQACQYGRIANKAYSQEVHVLPYSHKPHVLKIQHV